MQTDKITYNRNSEILDNGLPEKHKLSKAGRKNKLVNVCLYLKKHKETDSKHTKLNIVTKQEPEEGRIMH